MFLFRGYLFARTLALNCKMSLEGVFKVWLIFLDILGIFGGALAVVVGLSAWLGKVWANRILQSEINNHNIELEKLRGDMKKEIDRSKNQLDILKESSVRYSEFQFRLYNELWGELYYIH